jgi:hypothetical protein
MLRLAYKTGKSFRVLLVERLKEAGPRQGFFEREDFLAVPESRLGAPGGGDERDRQSNCWRWLKSDAARMSCSHFAPTTPRNRTSEGTTALPLYAKVELPKVTNCHKIKHQV